MCTRPHPTAREAAGRFLAATPGDPATYGTVADIESRAVSLLGRVADLSDPRGYDVVDPELPLVAADLSGDPFDALRAEGWRIARTRRGEARVVVMPHVTRETLRAFLDDCDRIA